MAQSVGNFDPAHGLSGDEKEAKDDQPPCVVNRHNPEKPILETLCGFDVLRDIICCRRCRGSCNGSKDECDRRTDTQGQQSSPDDKDGNGHHDKRGDKNLFAVPMELWKRQGSAEQKGHHRQCSGCEELVPVLCLMRQDVETSRADQDTEQHE